MLGLCLVVVSGSYPLAVVWGLPIAVAFLVSAHGLWSVQVSVVVAHGLGAL